MPGTRETQYGGIQMKYKEKPTTERPPAPPAQRPAGWYPKFQVFKTSDIEQYLNILQKHQFVDMQDDIAKRRKQDGLPYHDYLVINMDEPYAAEVIEIMKKHGAFKEEPNE